MKNKIITIQILFPSCLHNAISNLCFLQMMVWVSVNKFSPITRVLSLHFDKKIVRLQRSFSHTYNVEKESVQITNVVHFKFSCTVSDFP